MTPTRCVGGYEIAVDLIRPDMTPKELAAAQRETLARMGDPIQPARPAVAGRRPTILDRIRRWLL